MLPHVQPVPLRTLAAAAAAVQRVALGMLTAEAERQLEHEWQQRDYQRAQRGRRRIGVSRTRQCPRCRLFSVRAHCQHCGHVNTGAAA